MALTRDEVVDSFVEETASRLVEMRAQSGEFTGYDAAEVYARYLQGVTTDHLEELTYLGRQRIHNLKYYTWVEQQGKSYEEIQAQWYDPHYWTDVQGQAAEIDELIEQFNAQVGLS